MPRFTLNDHTRWISGHRYEFCPIEPHDGFRGTFDDVATWCIDRYGPIQWNNEQNSRWWLVKPNDFWFRDEQDAVEFRLRWC